MKFENFCSELVGRKAISIIHVTYFFQHADLPRESFHHHHRSLASNPQILAILLVGVRAGRMINRVAQV